MTQTTDMLKVELGAVADSKSRTLLKTIGRAGGGELWLACGLGFDVVPGS